VQAEGRLAFVDRLRGVATIAMIEVHVVNALLAAGYRGGAAFAALDFANGLVAPAFLVAAGLSLARSFAAPAWPPAPERRRLAARQARRAALLLALGYAMHASHLPAALSAGGADRDAAWASLLQTDVLQLIAASLAGLALAAALVPTARRYAALALAAAAACAWLGPAAHRYAWAGWPWPIATFFSGRFGSPFPIAPWAAFVALGAALGASMPPAAGRGAWARRLVLAGAAALALAALGSFAPWPRGGAFEPWALAPASTALRAGIVCLASAALAGAGAFAPSIERTLGLFGRHSLFIYVAHIVLVYGRHPLSLRSLVGPTQGPFACFAAWAAVSGAMALGALALRANRARRERVPPPPTPRRAP
jgi:uncharacterized membrane protein